jgi:hypothetical protein
MDHAVRFWRVRLRVQAAAPRWRSFMLVPEMGCLHDRGQLWSLFGSNCP